MLLAFMGPGIIAANAGNDAGRIADLCQCRGRVRVPDAVRDGRGDRGPGRGAGDVRPAGRVHRGGPGRADPRAVQHPRHGVRAPRADRRERRPGGLGVRRDAGRAGAAATSRNTSASRSRPPRSGRWWSSGPTSTPNVSSWSSAWCSSPTPLPRSSAAPTTRRSGAEPGLPAPWLAKAFLLLVVALIGTTITPYMQFYVAAAVADRGIGPADYACEKLDTIAGSIFCNVISIFIIIATAAAIHVRAPLEPPKQAAQALTPVACSVRHAAVRRRAPRCQRAGRRSRPPSTAYAISEVDRRRAQRQQVLPPGAAVPWPVHRTGLRRGGGRADPRQPDPAPGRRPGPERGHHAHPADVRPGPRQPQQRPRRRRERPRLQGRRHDQRHRRRDPLGDRARAIGPGRTGYRLIQRTAAALEPAAVR